MKKRIGFGVNAFKEYNHPIKKRKMKRISEDVYSLSSDKIVYFNSEEHLNILLYDNE